MPRWFSRTPRARSLAAALGSLLLGVGCSVLTSTEGLTGGEASGGAPKGGAPSGSDGGATASPPPDTSPSPGIDAGPEDTPDAPTPDAPPPDLDATAPVDASDAAPASALPFKDDFEGHALTTLWDAPKNVNGATALDMTNFVSSHTSVRSTSRALVSGDSVDIALRKRFAAPDANVTASLETSLFVSQLDAAHSADSVILAMDLLSGAGDVYQLQLAGHLTANGTLGVVFAEWTGYANGTEAYQGHPITQELTLGTWHRVRIEHAHTVPPIGRVYFDGAKVMETPIKVNVSGPKLQIDLGLSYVKAPSDPWVVFYDDVVYDAR